MDEHYVVLRGICSSQPPAAFRAAAKPWWFAVCRGIVLPIYTRFIYSLILILVSGSFLCEMMKRWKKMCAAKARRQIFLICRVEVANRVWEVHVMSPCISTTKKKNWLPLFATIRSISVRNTPPNHATYIKANLIQHTTLKKACHSNSTQNSMIHSGTEGYLEDHPSQVNTHMHLLTIDPTSWDIQVPLSPIFIHLSAQATVIFWSFSKTSSGTSDDTQ